MEWDEIKRALVVVAHPDDAEFGSSGTAAKMAREGKEVFYAVVTDGSKGSADPNATSIQMIETRQKEQRDAARVLGVKDVAFLSFEDGVLEPTIEVRKAISAAIRQFKPDVVITQSPQRNLASNLFVQHPDHLAVGEATFAAVYPSARDRLTFPDLLARGLEPHVTSELWVSGSSEADYFVDISGTIDLKVKALQAHQSQVGERDVATFVPDRAHQLGEQHGLEYAEGFKRIVIQ
ncbi:MAG: PIG-L deacetylase family protein [Chloroflexota bacterium]